MKSRLPTDLELSRAAIRAAWKAGAVLRRHFQKRLEISAKPGAGLVSNADTEAEAAAVKILKKAAPSFAILAEEGSKGAPQAQASIGRWIIDPLDGTTNYIHGFPMFCVSIAAEVAGVLRVGVIYHPLLKDTYVATLGKGAKLNGKSIRVSSTPSLDKALLTTGFTYRKKQWLHTEVKAFEYLSSLARGVRRPGAAALDLAYVARGVFDGFWEQRLSPWDVAAGILLVQEAGGRVSHFDGSPIKIDSGEILAANSNLHPKLIEALSDPRLGYLSKKDGPRIGP